MKQFLRLSSLLLLFFASCASPYKGFKPSSSANKTAYQYKPQFLKEVYRCTVNGRVLFKKFHLSGILLLKEMKNGTVRAIFQNEMGFTFFDFEWDRQDSFKVNSIIPQLDKPAVVKTLKKDFNLFLMKGLEKESEKILIQDRGKEVFYCFTIGEGYVYYVEEGNMLQRIENAGKKRKVTTISLMGKHSANDLADSVMFNHHKANFTISLHKINSHVDE
ncbi:MAG: hypothetical protein ACK4EY_15720 [Flavipsychrobacter sp.]